MILLSEAEVAKIGLGILPSIAVAATICVVAIVILLVIISNKGKKNNHLENTCPQCGKPVKNGKNFCTNCGAKIE